MSPTREQVFKAQEPLGILHIQTQTKQTHYNSIVGPMVVSLLELWVEFSLSQCYDASSPMHQGQSAIETTKTVGENQPSLFLVEYLRYFVLVTEPTNTVHVFLSMSYQHTWLEC